MNTFIINRAIDSIKQAEFELKSVDLRTVPVPSRKVIKDARTDLAKHRSRLTKSGRA